MGCLFIVLITELLNSAIEAIVDRASTDQHPLSGRAKDTASAAVFLALAVFIWSVIAWHDLFRLWHLAPMMIILARNFFMPAHGLHV